MTRTMNTRTCPNIRDLILKCTKTHESAQLGLGTQICVIILAIYWGSGRTRGRERRIVIKQSNAAQKSKNQIPHVIPPYHTTPKKNQNNQNTGSIPVNLEHCEGRGASLIQPASRPLPVAPSSKRQRRRLSGEPRASAQIESAIGRAFYRCGLL